MFTLQERILLFFAIAPDEELTYADIAAKCGANAKHIAAAVRALRDAGILSTAPIAGPHFAAGNRPFAVIVTPEAREIMLAPLAPFCESEP